MVIRKTGRFEATLERFVNFIFKLLLLYYAHSWCWNCTRMPGVRHTAMTSWHTAVEEFGFQPQTTFSWAFDAVCLVSSPWQPIHTMYGCVFVGFTEILFFMTLVCHPTTVGEPKNKELAKFSRLTLRTSSTLASFLRPQSNIFLVTVCQSSLIGIFNKLGFKFLAIWVSEA